MPTLAGIRVEGHSIGGIETCIDLPEWRIAFDIGRAPDFSVARDTILFTHAHMDHMGGVATHCATRALRRLPPPTYIVGPEHAQAFKELFEVWRRLDRSDLHHTLVVAEPGDEIPLGGRRVARPFRSVHRAPCQGYLISASKTVLAPRFARSTQAEIDAARLAGVEITRDIESSEFAFTGDTTIEVVEREACVRTARLLVLECTFLDDRVPAAQARAMGHVHLDDVVANADLFENEALLLSHLSARYSAGEAQRILDRRLPKHLRQRTTLFVSNGA